MKNVVLYVVMVTGLTALFVWLKGRNTERAPASSAMVVSPEDDAAHDVVLVDVRTPEEYRAGHKEGALNIPVDEVEQLAPQLLPDKNAVILFIAGRARGRTRRWKPSGKWGIPIWRTCTGLRCSPRPVLPVRGARNAYGHAGSGLRSIV